MQNKRLCAVQIQDKKGENTMVNKVRVNIAGTPYAIATTDSEKYILELAKKLDEDITKLQRPRRQTVHRQTKPTECTIYK